MKKRIFISHAHMDNDIVEPFIEHILIGALGFNHQEIVFTSGDGMGFNSGADWRISLKDSLLTVDVIFLIITPNYKSSEICLNEMGAAWATNDHVYPMIIDPINYKSVGVLAEVKQVEKLNSSKGLDNIYDELIKVLKDINRPKQAWWSVQKKKFIEEIDEVLKKKQFPEPLSMDTIIRLEENAKELSEENEILLKENKKLNKYIKVLENKKDTHDIIEAKYEVGLANKKDEFESLSDEVRRIIKSFDIALVTLIFNDYTQNQLEVNYLLYKSYIEKARAKKYMDEDYDILWNETTVMKQLLGSLNKLKKIIDDLDEENYNILLTEYESLDINNMTFWENVLEAKLIS